MFNPAKVRRRRDQLLLSQAEVAKQGALPGGAQVVSNLERGTIPNPQTDTLLALARGLRCSVADLVDEEYPPPRKSRKPGVL